MKETKTQMEVKRKRELENYKENSVLPLLKIMLKNSILFGGIRSGWQHEMKKRIKVRNDKRKNVNY